jgi:hypothetical protein
MYDARQLVPLGAFFTWPPIRFVAICHPSISLLNADHGNAAKHLLEEEPLRVLAMRRNEVDQH